MSTNALTDFVAVAEALKLSEAHACWQDAWEATHAVASDFLEQLNETALREACEFAHLEPAAAEAVLGERTALDAAPALAALAAHVAAVIHAGDTCGTPVPGHCPPLPEHLGATTSMFYAWVALAGVAQLRERHRAQGIPREITADTLRDVGREMARYRASRGHWGLEDPAQLVPHFRANLFELGSLQFCRSTWELDYHFFRDTLEPGVVAFTGEGRCFDPTGRLCACSSEQETWEAHFHVGHKIIRGNPVTPAGHAIAEMVSLPTVQWEPALRPGMAVLAVRVPEPCTASADMRREAFQRAHGFFAMYFPQERYAAFTLQSWMLDARWAQYLPEDDPLLTFQRDFYLLPGAGTCRVELPATGDPVRRALLQGIANEAGAWRDTPGVILAGDEAREPAWYRRVTQDTPWVPKETSRDANHATK